MDDGNVNRLHQDRFPLPPERDWRALWFVLALFVAQALLSVHSVEHLDDHAEEAACELCILGGGLKEIAFRLGISRPPDLQSADGEMAIRLWARWEHFQDAQAREDLIRYCVLDVLLLVVLANRLVGSDSMNAQDIWKSLPFSTGTAATTTTDPDDHSQQQPNAQAFGVGSPSRLRARRKRVG